ncbi:MAG: valine--pyruvate transaminase [Granulosicoccaceae bacterium]
MLFSDFGSKFRDGTGIGGLMRDLADLPETGNYCRLGGGNPANLAAITARFQHLAQQSISDTKEFERAFTRYGAAQGDKKLISYLLEYLNKRYDWQLQPQNIALTNGSQNAFFMLFNMFGGVRDGIQRNVLLPMAPEYIGYEDVAIGAPMFTANKPVIELVGDKQFKYRLDTDGLCVDANTAAICVSRPSNPTGNVLTDNEMAALGTIAKSNDLPLIIDNAYGAPFPDIIHVPATLNWNDNTILSMSFSKIGLPGIRTGIVVAQPAIIDTITQMNAVMNLSTGSAASSLFSDLFKNDQIDQLISESIKPFYAERAQWALKLFEEQFADVSARVHVAEGAIFLWLWFPELPISSAELYNRLKKKGVIVVPGHYFFPGIDNSWAHKHQCIRVNIAGFGDELQQGMSLIADEIKALKKTKK